MLVVEGDLHPHIFQRVRDLAEQAVNRFEAVGEHLVDAVLDLVAVAKIGDPDFAARLPDTLDAAFALLESRRVPRKVDVDERTEARRQT